MQAHSTTTRTNIFFIFLLGLFISLIGQNNHEFIQFESRFGLFIQEMLRNGMSFFPTTYNQFYPDYPATQTILSYLFSLPFGNANIYTAVLPTAIATGISLVFTYLIGATQNKLLGWYAVLFCLFTFAFITEARTISLDQFTVAATACSFYFAYISKSSPLSRWRERVPKAGEGGSKLIWFIPLSWLSSFIFRGPIGLIIPAAVTGGFYLLEKDYKKLFITAIGAMFLLALCMTGLLLAAWHTGGIIFMKKVIAMQALGRMSNDTSAPPFYYYFTSAIPNYAISLIIAVIVWCTYAKQLWRKSENPTHNLLRHSVVWFFIIVIGMSIPGDKKVRYVLAITPAIALTAAYLFSAEHTNKLLNQLRNLFNKFFILLPYFGLLILITAGIISHVKHISFEIYYISAAILFIMQIALSFWWARFALPTLQLHKIIIGLSAFLTICITIIQPITVQLNQVKPFAMQVEALRQQQALVFYQIGPDDEDIKYMVAINKPLQPEFLQTPKQLMAFHNTTIFITKKNIFDALPANIKAKFKVLMIGRLGHQTCVVFTR
jgi:4-amino-4-deoxy-L-arabinose transferase-like glycosyltransferase